MEQLELEPELERAKEEWLFWQDYASWWATERSSSTEPRIQEALDNAERRYVRILSDTGNLNSRKGYRL
jgi:hypothetical protein